MYAYYPFSGDTDDASGNGFHAEAMNGAALTTDRFGTNNSAYYFDGDNDFLKSPLKDMSYSDAASVTAIIQPDKITKNTYYNITRQGPHPANFLLAFQDRGKILSFGMFTGGSYKELDVKIDPADFVDGNWHCVAGVYDGAYMKLFVDGVLLGQTEKTGKVEKPGGAYNPIGSMIGRERFKGKIDEVRFYDRGLLNKEVGSLCDILHNNNPY